MNIVKWRKLIFAVAVFVISCVFLAVKLLPASEFRTIIIWIGNGFFLANVGEHVAGKVRKVKNGGRTD